ncbi:MAG: hypothetical protein R3B06_20320 [Kofleriaceae bacterium]
MRQLVFAYNADGGLANLLKDAAHKVLRPATYPCSLCAVTYGPLGMRRRWAAFVRGLPARVRFLHRDELRAEFGDPPDPLPALYEVDPPATLRQLIGKAALDACGDLDALEALVRARVG